jgi:hypothetical protein
MSTYQGRALQREPRARAAVRGRRTGRQVLRVLAVMAAMGALAAVPWRELRHRYAVLERVQVSGLRYLDGARIRGDAHLAEGQDLLSIDLARVRRGLLADPRIESAEVRRAGLRGIEVRVTERVPTLAVSHGEPWEIDSTGVLLEPLQRGVVADVPMLTGADFSRFRPGDRIVTPEVQRGLAWAAILSDNALRLAGQVSEVDISDDRVTRLVLMNGVRVIGTAWPPDTRQLSGLRATLADLQSKGMMPGEVDVRIPDQIIVRDAQATTAAPGEMHGRS